ASRMALSSARAAGARTRRSSTARFMGCLRCLWWLSDASITTRGRKATLKGAAMTRPLEGRVVALAEGRQLEELAALLAAEGAEPLRCPMLAILDAPDAAPVVAWLDELIAGRFALVVLMTGEAVRRLAGFAERAGKREAYVEALGRV